MYKSHECLVDRAVVEEIEFNEKMKKKTGSVLVGFSRQNHQYLQATHPYSPNAMNIEESAD